MTYEVVLEEFYQPVNGRPYTSETVVRSGLTYEEARRHAFACNTKVLSNQYYSYRNTPQK